MFAVVLEELCLEVGLVGLDASRICHQRGTRHYRHSHIVEVDLRGAVWQQFHRVAVLHKDDREELRHIFDLDVVDLVLHNVEYGQHLVFPEVEGRHDVLLRPFLGDARLRRREVGEEDDVRKHNHRREVADCHAKAELSPNHFVAVEVQLDWRPHEVKVQNPIVPTDDHPTQ